MAMSDTGPEDGSAAERPGGVGTITRPAAPSRVPPRRTRRGAPPRPARRRGTGPGQGVLAGARVQAARTLAPDAVRRRAATDVGPARSATARTASRHSQRMPFVLMLCVMLGGALICALVISTTLAAGSYRITRLQQANDALARQRQVLRDEVATERSAQSIQQRALRLGMRPIGELRFLNLKNGEIQTDAGTGANANIHVPGYNP